MGGARLEPVTQPTDTEDMEDFSTPRHPLVPAVANLCTLAVVLTAAWWSAAQRSDAGAAAVQQQSRAVEQLQPATATTTPVLGNHADTALWTLMGKGTRDSATVATLQPVGYQPASNKR
jgi:hypothetical protein